LLAITQTKINKVTLYIADLHSCFRKMNFSLSSLFHLFYPLWYCVLW